jgi:hypothetical protein
VYFSTDEVIRMLIQRFKCLSCRKTFNILPQFVVPYKRYCIFVILSLLDASQHGQSTHAVHKDLGLACSHIRYLLKQFRQIHLVGTLTLEEHIPPSEISSFMETYRIQFGYDFMQIVSVVK